MKRVLVLSALVAAVVLAGAGGSARGAGSACPTSNPPNELVLASGSGQQAQLGKQFAQNLQVALANTNDCPLTGNLAGVTVNFDAPGSGASGIFASSGSREAYVGTDAQGVATAPPFTANFTVGNYSVDAHSDYGTVNIDLSNTANGLPSSITATGTSSQEATVNGSYAQPLQARVTDANGNPVQGATVTFAVLPGPTGASASFLGGEPSAITDSNGLATSPPLVANGVPGRFTATASTAGVSTVATYTLDNHATTTALQLTSISDPKATVDTRYRASLQARLLDANGQPIEGATVTFAITAADDGAAATFLGGAGQATALTDVNGLATAPPLIANKTAGSFTATATAAGAQPGQYTLENLAAAPAGITAGAANGESSSVGMRFPIPLAVTVTDKNGNPVSGATVRFTAPTKGASGHFTLPSLHHPAGHNAKKNAHAQTTKKTRVRTSRSVRVRTNSKGIAVAPPFSANASVGGYAVTATVNGSSVRTAFSLLNLPRG
jgi:protocatechuate 3,4-dioxygenase beta subunit